MLPNLISAIPGPTSLSLADELRQYESPNITFLSPDFPVFWERASGVNVWDVDGNQFLDLTSGFGVSSLGFNAVPVVSRGTEQLSRLHHAMGDVHPAASKVKLCRELSRWTFECWGAGPAKSILTNSGGEAVEAALKTAYLATGKKGVISFHNGYHGLGYGALTVSGLPEFRTPFAAQLADLSYRIDFPCNDKSPGSPLVMERQIRQLAKDHEIGAILFEPMQGRAGVIVPPDWFLPLLRELSTELGILLIADEIYTGFYKTGRRFACDTSGVVPDLICLGKALTNGFPLAACVGKSVWMNHWPNSTGEALHTSTFLGNPLGCEMALATLLELEGAQQKYQIMEKGLFFRQLLQDLKIGPVRGTGLLLGLELPDSQIAGKILVQGLKRGLILLTGGPNHNVLTLTPPFPLENEEIVWTVKTIAALL